MQTRVLLPPSVDEGLPEKHLARFVVEVIDGFDLRAMAALIAAQRRTVPECCWASWCTAWQRAYSRAGSWSGATRWYSVSSPPTIIPTTTQSRRSGGGFSKRSKGLLVQVLRAMCVLKTGTIGLDGTKIHANASRHNALSHEHAGKIEAQLQAEVADLMARRGGGRGGPSGRDVDSTFHTNWHGARSVCATPSITN
jgi:hypothetical protein